MNKEDHFDGDRQISYIEDYFRYVWNKSCVYLDSLALFLRRSRVIVSVRGVKRSPD